MDQLDGKPWGNLDFAGSSVGAVKGAAPARSGGGLWADIGFDCLQPGAQASDRAASSVCGAAGCGAADSPSGGASFPSGHTAASFAAVFALKASGSPLWKPALLWALLIAFSRLYLYVHWPSDVLGGAVLGAVVGWLGAKLAAAAADRISPEAK